MLKLRKFILLKLRVNKLNMKPYYRKPKPFLLFRGDIVLELVLSDVVELQPEIMIRRRYISETKINMRMMPFGNDKPP